MVRTNHPLLATCLRLTLISLEPSLFILVPGQSQLDPRVSWTGRDSRLPSVRGGKWGLYRHIRFNSAAEECRWSEEEKKWKTAVKITGDKASEYGKEYTITS